MLENLILKVGKDHTLNQIISGLVDLGYQKTDVIESPGEFSLDGGLLKIFSINVDNPIVVDFFGEEIEQIYSYSILEMKRIEKYDSFIIESNVLVLLDRVKIHQHDYLVHEDHGIGQFGGFVCKKIENEMIRYIVISYLNNDKLYVPFSQLSKLSGYIGVGRKKPKLNKLGSNTWTKTYKKTYEDVLKLARELLQIYAIRELTNRIPLKIDQKFKNEIAKTFGFVETSDQEEALNQVYQDIVSPIPMDRLICGDVGFGKTEIAIRISAQFVANGFQVAILVPTTILAEQHFATLQKRFASLPVNIARVSRFVTSAERSRIMSGLANGSIDILIATHSLVRSEIKFRNLGLLVIDEEQKFGVKDKEKIKNLKENIDVLALTATPIPRTLFMSLSGIRDLSLISCAPLGRKSIETEIIKYDEIIIRRYIDREIGRGGQVYYLHNKVSTIVSVVKKLQMLYPDLVIESGHGQLSEEKLAEVMKRFTLGEIDILVCSTIIENGLDLPNANTMIVEDSDHFGLSQLYQLRGRIGRSPKQSYALFTYSCLEMTANALKRLKALADNNELGTGYNIALSDLEIRGGGNILGRDQHGNMEAVGLVLYSKLLKLATEKLKDAKEIDWTLANSL